MKLTTTNALLSVAFFLFPSATMVNAYDLVQMLFDQQHAGACSSNDWDIIDAAILEWTNYDYRKLRGSDAAIVSNDRIPVDENNRALWPWYCANRCDGFAPRTCKAVNCVGYRRGLVETMKHGLYQAFLYFDCSSQSADLEQVISGIIWYNRVSPACVSYLNIPRQYSCYTDAQCYYVVPDAPTDDIYIRSHND